MFIGGVNRVFLLSPAHSGGRRAAMLTRAGACFALAQQVQARSATLGDVFTFCSGLYFRGKLAYARRFGKTRGSAQVITSSRGLLPAHTTIGFDELREFASVPIDAAEADFIGPLQRSARLLAAKETEVVLLGSIASGKYVDCLLPILGERLLFPREFVGRGDMSRGGLMLRCVASGEELDYVPVDGAIRRGTRPPRLVPLAR